MGKENLYDEIVDLDQSFYVWFLPRLVCFRKHNKSFPEKYGDIKSWNQELDNVICSLNELVNNPDLGFEEFEERRKFVRQWVGENLNHLWL